jgi:tRNA1Val (adenine37-N6)-methyltransferase
MEYFQFKQFKVKNVASAMRLGTDSVLLGAWAPLHPGDTRVLDIGTGTGVVALMIAQRLCSHGNISIDAIDIDLPSVEEAAHNFAISPWSGALRAIHTPLQEFLPEEKYDLIVSNPPYFVDSLKAPSKRRSQTRHTDTLPHGDLIASAFSLLRAGGRMVVILPREEGEAFIRNAELFGVGTEETRRLFLRKTCKVRTSLHKEPKRYLMEFLLVEKGCFAERCEDEYISLNGDDRYTEMVREFLLNIQ